MLKPARLEMGVGRAWTVLGRFDAADDEQTSLVLDAAEDLVKTLHNSEDAAGCPQLRVTVDDAMREVLVRWQLERGWYDVATGAPF